MTSTLGDDFPNQQARIRRARDTGRDLGPSGFYYVAVAEDLLRRADKAAISGDVVEMLMVYQEMQEFKE